MGSDSHSDSDSHCHPILNQVCSPLASTKPCRPHRRRKDKVVFVVGTTGTGKSRLSIDLATCFDAEIVNSDKMQVYKGLDVLTNKVTEEECAGVPHHLLGVIDPDDDFTASDFRCRANDAVESILARDRLPIIAGGSNRYIEALVDGEDRKFRSKYDCCFLWVDVSLPVLYPSVADRVDRMVDAGMVDEVKRLFRDQTCHNKLPAADYMSRGIRRAIGVPEMDRFLRAEMQDDDGDSTVKKKQLFEAAVWEIKVNTCRLAERQLRKIERLRGLPGWHVHRLDATQVFRRGGLKDQANDPWRELVAAPAVEIVGKFLDQDGEEQQLDDDMVDGTCRMITSSAISSKRKKKKKMTTMKVVKNKTAAVAAITTN